MSMTNTLATLIRNWTGSAPPPVSRRQPATRWGSPGAVAADGLDLRVVALVDETPTVRTLVLEAPSGKIPYRAGQHLTVRVDVDGQILRRCYSFSTSPLGDGSPAITVRRVDGGAVSAFLHDRLRVGGTLKADPAAGTFTLPDEDRGERRFVCIGGGVGVTPLMSLAETALRRDAAAEVDFLCGHRREDEIVFHDRLLQLQREFAPRLRVRFAVDEPGEGWTGLAGAMGGSRVLDEAGTAADAYYVCGPEPMMADVSGALQRAGVDPARIRSERFAYAPPASGSAPATPREILFAGSGRRVVAQPGQTILDAATKAGIDLPFSCTMGGCGACKVKKTAGTVVAPEPNCLTDAERAEGYVLTCCSYADDGLVLADH